MSPRLLSFLFVYLFSFTDICQVPGTNQAFGKYIDNKLVRCFHERISHLALFFFYLFLVRYIYMVNELLNCF